jgi:diacylglycerol kinase family enzyme
MARLLVAFPFPGYRITVDGKSHEAASVVVAKGRYYAGRYLIAPEAELAEPAFQVCLFEHSGSLAALRYANAMRRGRLAEHPGYRVLAARRVSIEGPLGDPVQADGDIVATLPVTIEIVPDALQLAMPAARA